MTDSDTLAVPVPGGPSDPPDPVAAAEGAEVAEVAGARLRTVATADLSAAEQQLLREMLVVAFGTDGFDEDDWHHATGGMHFILESDQAVVAHASVVPRELRVDARPLRTGYVEAVGVVPDRQGTGLGTIVMRAAGAHIQRRFELGALGTGSHRFYERLGWETWRGPTSVRTLDGLRRTADEDGYILVLRTPSSPPLDLSAPISCEWRPGDVW